MKKRQFAHVRRRCLPANVLSKKNEIIAMGAMAMAIIIVILKQQNKMNRNCCFWRSFHNVVLYWRRSARIQHDNKKKQKNDEEEEEEEEQEARRFFFALSLLLYFHSARESVGERASRDKKESTTQRHADCGMINTCVSAKCLYLLFPFVHVRFIWLIKKKDFIKWCNIALRLVRKGHDQVHGQLFSPQLSD